MNLLELSQNIRRVRLAQKMTVEQLAKQSGFSKGFISQVENFRTTPSLKALEKIAAALGISLGDLFSADSGGVEFSFSSVNDGVELLRNDSDRYGIRYLALAHSQPGRKMDPFILEYTPQSRANSCVTIPKSSLFCSKARSTTAFTTTAIRTA